MDDQAASVRQLGKRELGPHAFEQQMPEPIAALLKAEDYQNKVDGVIPILANLLRQEQRLETAYLCDERTRQIYKLKGEGNHFCGYRNIQMMLPQRQYSIPELQDMIEQAWDQGHNSHGRTQTGGVKGTRKHIGTSEAEALFLSLDMPCSAKVFSGKKAWHDLLNAVERYFTNSSLPTLHDQATNRVYQTSLPPLFLQGPYHSLTIIGIEILRNGKRQLFVFDPGFRPLSFLQRRPDSSRITARFLLATHRRGEGYLKRYNGFELLWLDRKP